MCACDLDKPDTAGASHRIGDQFVIITYRFGRDRIRWVAVVNFPITSTAEERLKDKRVFLAPGGGYLIRQTDARRIPPAPVLLPPDEPRLYFFDGDQLVTFPIRMTEEQLGDLENSNLASYAELLTGFRKFEVKAITPR